ncbi:MAG: hypothetical protein RL161_127 [Bacteroidota bacterium]|jgi:uncharacterized protein (DUF885 family)
MRKNQFILGLLILSMAVSSCTQTDLTLEKKLASEKLNSFLAGFSQSRGRNSGHPEDSMSSQSFKSYLEKTRKEIDTLQSIDTTLLTGDDLIDWKFALSILRGREIDHEKIRPWTRDPRLYMTFTSLSAVMDGPGTPEEKAEKIRKRLKMAVVQMDNGINQLEVNVPRFRELGIFMAENSRVLFSTEIPAFIKKNSISGLDADVSAAQQQLEKFISFLKEGLPKKPEADFAIGKEAYNELLRDHYLLEYDADSLYEFGLAQFEATVRELEAFAQKIKPGTPWKALANEVKQEYPEPHSMIPVHQEWVNKTREHVLKHNLIPIPWKERVLVIERAPYLRKTSYYGHFSFAKKKDADSTYTSEMHINPFEDQWTEKQKQEYLVEHDWGVILVTAPHETYAGHHIQGLYQVNNPRPLRRNNSISIFSEGWGLYNEQLFRETGFFPNDKILLRQLQLRLWRNARVVYDVGMHTGKMTYDDAVKLMTEGVGFLPWASQLEIDASCASPGYFIGYFTGMMEILRMREDYKKIKGDQFTLSDFHERLLKIGSMPIVLMREALLQENQ